MSNSTQTIVKEHLAKQEGLDLALLTSIVDDVITANTSTQNAKLQELLQAKEKLELEIKAQTAVVHTTREDSFTEIETSLYQELNELEPSVKKQLTQLKLQSIDILDVLTEITESAFISALENGENLEATFHEIARDLTLKTLRDGYLTLERAKHVVGTIISKATDIAEASPNSANNILRGTLYGTKKGLTQSISIFKDRFAFIPDEIQPLQIKHMQQTVSDLKYTDKLFIEAINEQAAETNPLVQKVLLHIVERMRPDLSELINVSKEAIALVSDTLSTVSKEALQKSQTVLQSKAAIEAKRMGVNVWDVAKSALGGAINSAKDAMEKNKK